jgi:hypothetical protein
MRVTTTHYSIEIRSATVGLYTNKVPAEGIVRGIINGGRGYTYKDVYLTLRFLQAVGVNDAAGLVGYTQQNAGANHTKDNGYQYLIWLINPDVCPLEYLLELTYIRAPYAWAARAFELISKYNLGLQESINLLKTVRVLRIAPPTNDFILQQRNKEARAAFLCKYSVLDAFAPEVAMVANRAVARSDDILFSPKFASRNSRHINLARLPTREEFFAAFHEATFGIFREFEHWSRVCVAGGMISKLLTGDKSTNTSDIDMFITGDSMAERAENFATVSVAICAKLEWLYPARKLYVIPRGSVMSIYVADTAIKIQIIAGVSRSIADTISRFDFSPSCAGIVGDMVYITHDFLESFATGVAVPVNCKRITPARIIKLLWRGWAVQVNDEVREQVDTNKLVAELESKNDVQLIAELDACMMLTKDNSFNILILTRMNENSTILTDIASGLSMIEFDADFGSYMRSTFSWRKFFRAMSTRVITPPRNRADITIPAVHGGRALILSAEKFTVVTAPATMQREQYAYRFTCSAEPAFLQFCRELITQAYPWWGNAIVSVPCIEGDNVVFYIPRDYHRKKFFSNEIGEEIDPKSVAVGSKISLLAFKITMKYRHYPGVYLECTEAILTQGVKFQRIDDSKSGEESAVIYDE